MMEEPEGFQDFMRKFMEFVGQDQGPRTQNPTKYPRYIKITDMDACLLLMDVMDTTQRMERLLDEAKVVFHEREAKKAKLFLMLGKLYPEVDRRHGGRGGTGWRVWKGEYYYVGHDEGALEEMHDNSPNTQGED